MSQTLQFSYPASDVWFRASDRHKIQPVHLTTQTGMITEIRERSETKVHGRGSYDFVQIDSDTTVIQELWVRYQSGREDCVKLANWEVEARRGHIVTFVRGYCSDGSLTVLFFRNHSTNTTQFNQTEIRRCLIPKPSFAQLIKLPSWLVVLIVLWGFVGQLPHLFWQPITITACLGFFWHIHSLSLNQSEIQSAIQQIRSALLSMTVPI